MGFRVRVRVRVRQDPVSVRRHFVRVGAKG